MSTIYNSTPTAGNTEDVFGEQELERELEETQQGGESTEKMTDQDGQNGGSSDGDSDPDMTTTTVEGVEGSNEQETIPSTFFSAMAYSIEAYLSAINAQQEAALTNIDLYVDQVKQQFETTKSLASTIRAKIRAEAKQMFIEAYTSIATGAISAAQAGMSAYETRKITRPLNDATTERHNLQTHYDNMQKPKTMLADTKAPGRVKAGADPVGHSLREAAARPADVIKHKGADGDMGFGNAEHADYGRRLKDGVYAADHRISGLHSQMQTATTKLSIYAEILKSAAQATGSMLRAGIQEQIGDLESNRTYLENARDLISSLIQQIQGRVSSSSKGALDGIDTLRNSIRQFQG